MIGRRGLIGSALGALVAGCTKIGHSETGASLLATVEEWNLGIQRALSKRTALAREFSIADISPTFRGNGSTNPGTPAYLAHVASEFADWRLAIDGLVERPLALSLAQLKALEQRTQITRHDCVEGWSASIRSTLS